VGGMECAQINGMADRRQVAYLQAVAYCVFSHSKTGRQTAAYAPLALLPASNMPTYPCRHRADPFAHKRKMRIFIKKECHTGIISKKICTFAEN